MLQQAQDLVLCRAIRTSFEVPLDSEDLREMFRLRQLVEVDAAARAAPVISDEQRATLEQELERMSEARDPDAFWQRHNAFHSALLAPVMTHRLRRLTTELWQAAERYIRIVDRETDVLVARSAYRHKLIVEAARTRHPTTIKNALAEHLHEDEREIEVWATRLALAPAPAPSSAARPTPRNSPGATAC